ncbi:hypothetical protein D910_10964 [Dendroctonus ponderosae]|uniref:RING-type domain-containing protein n=1 Tax=Dendroctonus ponderosae TaxID=77166 RepID=U4UU02_DENPD|nr:hypothetical protein D910_10964 [Dendroctonus ponderosae]
MTLIVVSARYSSLHHSIFDEMDVEIFNEVEDSAEDGGLELSSQSAPIPFDDDDGSTCPVCLESWTNCGDHRICCLKCGHLFG